MTQEPFFTRLPGRALLKITGTDRRKFLQGLISNDIELLDRQLCIYACLLTPQGKFLFDFFIHEEDSALVLDCEGGPRASDLKERLDTYKLRDDINILLEDNITVFVVFSAPEIGLPDPRHSDMGTRTTIRPDNMPEKPFDVWDTRRIRLGIPDGIRDMVPNQSTLLECHIDKFHGVSFDKGCYMGQELTARMHYRGLAKKNLYTVTPEMLGLSALSASLTPLERDGHIIGEMRSSCGNVGLALLKNGIL